MENGAEKRATAVTNCLPSSMTKCPNCPRKDKSKGEIDNSEDTLIKANGVSADWCTQWCVPLICIVCSTKWSICNQCLNSSVKMTTIVQLRRHYSTYHIKKKKTRNEAFKEQCRQERTVIPNRYTIQKTTIQKKRSEGPDIGEKRKREELQVDDAETPRKKGGLTRKKGTDSIIRSPPVLPVRDTLRTSSDRDSSFQTSEMETGNYERMETSSPACSPQDHGEPPWDSSPSVPINAVGITVPLPIVPDVTVANQNIHCFSDACLKQSRDQSMKFYEEEFKSKGGGGRYLLSQSFYRGSRKPDTLKEDDVQILLQLTSLVHSLSTRQNKLLGSFLDLLFKKIDVIKEQNKNNKNRCVRCECGDCQERNKRGPDVLERLPPIPRTYSRLRAVIINGPNAFIPRLPYPKIYSLDNHAYVLPSDCIKHFLASGNRPLLFNKFSLRGTYQYANETPRGVQIAEAMRQSIQPSLMGTVGSPHLPLSYVEWKDDCETSKSNKASKSGSIWVFTITIFLKNKGNDSPFATFPVVVGPKSSSHDRLEKIIADDMKYMTSYRIPGYLGGSKEGHRWEEITFSAQLYCSLGDQPERRSGNCLFGGNSNSHARWRYACDHSKFLPVLPSCIRCVELMTKGDTHGDAPDWYNTSCHDCTNWMIGELKDKRLSYKARKDFPVGYLLGGTITNELDGMINPIVLDYCILKAVVSICHKKLSNGEWSLATSEAFLSENGIDTRYTTMVLNHASNVKQLSDSYSNRESDPGLWSRVCVNKKANPEKYLPAPIPAIWNRDLPLNLFIDTPMHLLFLGVVKAVFGRIGEWASKAGRATAFNHFAKKKLESVEALKLQWLTFNVKTFGGWAGWVSEKFQSLSRIALWLYGPLLVVTSKSNFTEPEGDLDTWNADSLRMFLRVRGLPEKGKKQIIHSMVARIKSLPATQQPPLLPDEYGPAEDVLAMLRSMVLMLTTILQPSFDGESHSRILSLRIRMFLNNLEKFDAPLRRRRVKVYEDEPNDSNNPNRADAAVTGKKKTKKKKFLGVRLEDGKPMWLSKFNFLCLLNLPEALREFGPARNYFEGKYLGERFVQEVKSTRQRCPPRNVNAVLLEKLHQGKALEAVMLTQSENLVTLRATEATNTKRKDLVGNVRIYPDLKTARQSLLHQLPLSILVTREHGFGVLFYATGSNKGRVSFLKINRVSDEETIHQGLVYWSWVVSDIVSDLEDVFAIDYGALLPRIGVMESQENMDFRGLYSKSTKEWDPEMLEHFEYSTTGMKLEKMEMNNDGIENGILTI